ncbi:MAG: amino acid-binding protein [Candidatus Limnocylindrales bacterium]|jgi:hypothetical protein
MTIDLTVGLVNRPGTLLRATDALARAGINIDGACGYLHAGQGVYHVLVQEAERARRALLDAGLEIQAERHVVVTPIENRPGSEAEVLRRVAEAGVNIDLLYATADGRLVLGGDDVPAIRRALG